MRTRAVTGLLLLAALLLYVGVARPSRKQAGDAADEYRRARNERREIQARLAKLERRDAARRRAATSLVQAAPASGEEAVRRARRSVVEALGGVSVRDTRLSVQASRQPPGARVRLSTQGSYEEILRLCTSLSRPESGLILNRVGLRPAAAGTVLDLEAVASGAGS